MEPIHMLTPLNYLSSDIYKNYGRLPDVLQGNVFSFLFMDEVINCHLLNKQLYKMAKKIIDSNLIWDKLVIQINQSQSIPQRKVINELKDNRKYIIDCYNQANQLIVNFFIFMAHKKAYFEKAKELIAIKNVLTDSSLNCFSKFAGLLDLSHSMTSYYVSEEGQRFPDQIEEFFSSHTLEYPFGSKEFIEVNFKQHLIINRFILNAIPANLETLRFGIKSGYLYLFELCIQKNFKVLPEVEFIEFCQKYIKTPMKKQVYEIALQFILHQPHDFAKRYKPLINAKIPKPDPESIDYLYCDILVRLTHQAEPGLLKTVLNMITFFEDNKIRTLTRPPKGFLINMIDLLLLHDWSAYTEFLKELYNALEIPPEVLPQFSKLDIGI